MSNKVKQSKKDETDEIMDSDSSDSDSDFESDEEIFSDISIVEENKADKDSSEEEIEYEKDSSDEEEEDYPMHKMFNVLPNLETLRNHPPDIKLKYTALDLCFHPTEQLLASCNYVGDCVIFRYDSRTTEKLTRLRHHKKSCRKVGYTSDGTSLCSISEDKSFAFIDVNTSKIKTHIKDAHDSGLTAMAEIDNNTWTTGDDEGTIKIWDLRRSKATFTYKSEAEEAVVDFTMDENDKYLVAAFENCSILPIRLKKFKPLEETIAIGDNRCTSLTIVNENTPDMLAVAGTESGKLVLFHYGSFMLKAYGLIHSRSVNCLLPYSDTKLITGSDDGKIRLAGIGPSKFYGVIGTTTTASPILSLASSNTDDFIASSSADDKIQFWTTKKMENIKSTRHNPLNRRRSCRKNEKILKSSRTRSVGQFLRDVKGTKNFAQKSLPTYSRELE